MDYLSRTHTRCLRHLSLWMVGSGCLWLLSGCAREDVLQRFPVSGTISIEGTLVPEGRIRFVPLPGNASPAVEGAVKDGLFAIPQAEGPIAGKYQIAVVPAGEARFAADDEEAYAQAAKSAGGQPVLPGSSAAVFANATEEMIAEVKADDVNDFNFQLRKTP